MRILIILCIILMTSCISTQVSQNRDFYNDTIKKEYIKAERISRLHAKYNYKNRKIINRKIDRKQSKPADIYRY